MTRRYRSRMEMTLPVYLNRLCLQCVSVTSTPPPQTARVLAIMHTAMYDAWTMYQTEAQPYRLSIALRRPPEEHTESYREVAIIYAAYRVLHAYFYLPLLVGKRESILRDAMDELEVAYKELSLDARTPEGLGNLAGQAMLDYSFGDGSNVWNTMGGNTPYADYTDYRPTLAPDERPGPGQWGDWQPLAVPQPGTREKKIQQFLVPQWGDLKPFALRNGWFFRPSSGPDRSKCYLKEECEKLIQISGNLTDKQKAIAEYWQDGPDSVTPPGHWCTFADWMSKHDRHDMEKDIRLFFVLANALFDASIAAWDSKRVFNYVRPVTAIRHLFKGESIQAWGGHQCGGTRTMSGEDWHPYQDKYFVTPPFAEYPSGHSVFSGAAADILERFRDSSRFGYRAVFPAKSSRIEIDAPFYDVELSWSSFYEASREAGMSRLYGGIHFEKGNLDGLEMGEKVAQKVWAKCSLLWKGIY